MRRMVHSSALIALVVLSLLPVIFGGTKTILHLADAHINSSLDSNTTQNPLELTDSSFQLFQEAIAFAATVLPNPDFVWFTGDHISHGSHTGADLRQNIQRNLETIDLHFKKAKKITAVLGNSDFYPSYNLTNVDPQTGKNPSIEAIAGAWNELLTPEQMETFRKGGYFKYRFDRDLYVLVLNTVTYAKRTVTFGSEGNGLLADPFDQLDWLNTQLEVIRDEGCKAYILGHIPPIVDSHYHEAQWHEDYVEAYKSILGKYTNVVLAQMFGHVHSFEVRLPLPGSVLESMYSPIFTTGAISPFFGNNPTFTIWTIDSLSFEVLDYTVYVRNITNPSESQNWKKLFSATEAYGIQTLSTTEYRRLIDRMVVNETLFDLYYQHSKGDPGLLPICNTTTCRAEVLCSTDWLSNAQDYASCVEQKNEIIVAENTPFPYVKFALIGAALAVIVVLLASTILRVYNYARRNNYSSLSPVGPVLNIFGASGSMPIPVTAVAQGSSPVKEDRKRLKTKTSDSELSRHLEDSKSSQESTHDHV